MCRYTSPCWRWAALGCIKGDQLSETAAAHTCTPESQVKSLPAPWPFCTFSGKLAIYINMGYFRLASALVLLAATVVGVLSAPAANYFWSSWTDGKAKIQQKNGPDGQFSVKWSGDKGNFVIGKGWNTGSNR